MAIRDDLITQLTTNLSRHDSYNISSDLPYVSGEQPLYEKNMKTVYVDEQQEDVEELFNCLDNNDVMQTETTVSAYLVTDAKNQTSDIDTVIANCLIARNGVTASQKSSIVTTNIENDIITYTFEYEFVTV